MNDIDENIWVTKDGEEIPIAELEDGHLINILKLLYSCGFIPTSVLNSYLGLGPNGDMAQLCFEQEQSRVFCCPTDPRLDNLEKEATKRNINVEDLKDKYWRHPYDEIEEEERSNIKNEW